MIILILQRKITIPSTNTTGLPNCMAGIRDKNEILQYYNTIIPNLASGNNAGGLVRVVTSSGPNYVGLHSL
jgi:hypothetical protein